MTKTCFHQFYLVASIYVANLMVVNSESVRRIVIILPESQITTPNELDLYRFEGPNEICTHQLSLIILIRGITKTIVCISIASEEKTNSIGGRLHNCFACRI